MTCVLLFFLLFKDTQVRGKLNICADGTENNNIWNLSFSEEEQIITLQIQLVLGPVCITDFFVSWILEFCFGWLSTVISGAGLTHLRRVFFSLYLLPSSLLWFHSTLLSDTSKTRPS